MATVPESTKPGRPADARQSLPDGAVLACFAALGIVTLAYDLAVGLPLRIADRNWLGMDFVNMWFGARLAWAGDLATLFDWPRYMAYVRGIAGPDYPLHNWSYPPHVLLFVWPLARLDYGPALLLWDGLGYLAYALALRTLFAARAIRPSPVRFALAFVAPGAVANIVFGHVGLFVTALFTAGMAWRDRRPWLAGLMFGLMTMKPHLGAVVPILLLAERRWTVIASAGLSTAVLVAITSAVFGWSVFPDYLRQVGPVQTAILMTEVGLEHLSPTWFAGIRTWNLAPEWGWPVLAVTAPLGILAVVLAVRRDLPPVRRNLVVALAAFMVTPYAFLYDLALTVPFLALYLGLASTSRARTLAVLALLSPLLPPVTTHLPIPLTPLILTAVLVEALFGEPVADAGAGSDQRVRA